MKTGKIITEKHFNNIIEINCDLTCSCQWRKLREVKKVIPAARGGEDKQHEKVKIEISTTVSSIGNYYLKLRGMGERNFYHRFFHW